MFKIVTDSTADLPVEYLKEHDLGCMNLSYIMDGVTYGQGQELPEKEFYALMRKYWELCCPASLSCYWTVMKRRC